LLETTATQTEQSSFHASCSVGVDAIGFPEQGSHCVRCQQPLPILSSDKAAEQKSLEELFRVAKSESQKAIPTSSDLNKAVEETTDGKANRQIKNDFKEMLASGGDTDSACTSSQVIQAILQY